MIENDVGRSYLLRTTGILVVAGVLTLLFVKPVRNHVTNFFSKERVASEEEKVLGDVSGRNPHVRELQNILKDIGFQLGPIDGEMGPRTRDAIRKFQKAERLRSTGIVDFKTWAQVNERRKSVSTLDTASLGDPILEEIPFAPLESAPYIAETREVTEKSDLQDEIMSYRLKSKDRGIKIQTALKRAGFYTGDIDGKVGSQTKQAIRGFQRSKGLAPDGVVGPKTWEELRGYLEE
ncbi:MAG: peptidoglycan-binding protein [Candidatus Omnitrophica bacterium]|nr:peptidoglycan-binding protein [Candidatus Omnitrophota bacterium]